MKYVRSFAALALACCGTSALAMDWRVATATEGALGYIDADSVRRDGDRIVFTVAVVFFPPARTTGRTHARYEGDCAEMTARPTQLTAFRPDGSSADVPIAEAVRRPEPGTNLHIVLTAACTRRFEGATIPDVDAHAAAAARGPGRKN
ncbi:MAG TPA: surface-adhesin E family protein [Allosphingosinicella sp.]|jgi:hypothetical protein